MWIQLLTLELIYGATDPSAPAPTPTPSSGVAHGGGGFRRERWQPKRPSLADVVELAVQDVIAELRAADEPEVRERVEAIVAPHVVKPSKRARPRIDYDALERDLAAIRALARLLVEQRQQEYDEDEEEEAMIYAAL